MNNYPEPIFLLLGRQAERIDSIFDNLIDIPVLSPLVILVVVDRERGHAEPVERHSPGQPFQAIQYLDFVGTVP